MKGIIKQMQQQISNNNTGEESRATPTQQSYQPPLLNRKKSRIDIVQDVFSTLEENDRIAANVK
eukprot:c39199_g1_i1 orf=70-261(+)